MSSSSFNSPAAIAGGVAAPAEPQGHAEARNCAVDLAAQNDAPRAKTLETVVGCSVVLPFGAISFLSLGAVPSPSFLCSEPLAAHLCFGCGACKERFPPCHRVVLKTPQSFNEYLPGPNTNEFVRKAFVLGGFVSAVFRNGFLCPPLRSGLCYQES